MRNRRSVNLKKSHFFQLKYKVLVARWYGTGNTRFILGSRGWMQGRGDSKKTGLNPVRLAPQQVHNTVVWYFACQCRVVILGHCESLISFARNSTEYPWRETWVERPIS